MPMFLKFTKFNAVIKITLNGLKKKNVRSLNCIYVQCNEQAILCTDFTSEHTATHCLHKGVINLDGPNRTKKTTDKPL